MNRARSYAQTSGFPRATYSHEEASTSTGLRKRDRVALGGPERKDTGHVIPIDGGLSEAYLR